jgi:hypothetical protein
MGKELAELAMGALMSIRGNRRPRWVRFAATGWALGAAGCTLLLDRTAEQCRVDGDCARLGSHLLCDNGLCVPMPRAAADDASATVGPSFRVDSALGVEPEAAVSPSGLLEGGNGDPAASDSETQTGHRDAAAVGVPASAPASNVADASIESDVGTGDSSPTVVAAPDAAAEASACRNDLSSIGIADFRISFTLRTSQAGWAALVSQRDACRRVDFWDVRLRDGKAFAETSGGASYTSLVSTAVLNDDVPHSVLVQRLAGTLTIQVDGVGAGSAASQASFAALPPLRTGSDVCETSTTTPTLPLVGSIANLCIASP